ncbi:glutathione S-transferase [Cupriavidus sp. YR651]|uniref:glutathione S-transferase family protein n=1 Tax=Cupriavidus sp. YR651 TaxID=1855315 RepID=UPI00087DFBF2|nr:glutathione S-transferase [Cupriavidus sp. YR651]SDE00602.1 glutathione S-transferase [Cupriavidus sp. YR651]
MLQILGKASSVNVRKVLWACAELDLAFTREDWGSGFRPTSTPASLALNPNAMVPVIRDGDFALWESNTIIRYLANRENATHLYPTAAPARARVDQWMDWQATDLNKSWTYAFLALTRRQPDYQDPEQIAQFSTAWTRHMAVIEGQLERTGGFIAGASFTLADIPIGLSVNRWLETPLAHEGFPATLAYMERMRRQPGYADYCRNGTP